MSETSVPGPGLGVWTYWLVTGEARVREDAVPLVHVPTAPGRLF